VIFWSKMIMGTLTLLKKVTACFKLFNLFQLGKVDISIVFIFLIATTNVMSKLLKLFAK